jgi:hypothetical protein
VLVHATNSSTFSSSSFSAAATSAAVAAAAAAAVLQSSSGAASTLERLTKETDANISQVHADVAAKKNLVRFEL